ncbi:MAG: hypothetical protein ACHP7G_10265, partial [Actinomycetales bacterium]
MASDAPARKVADVVNQKMAEWNMRAVILKVTKGDRTIARQAFGPSMDQPDHGVPRLPGRPVWLAAGSANRCSSLRG